MFPYTSVLRKQGSVKAGWQVEVPMSFYTKAKEPRRQRMAPVIRLAGTKPACLSIVEYTSGFLPFVERLSGSLNSQTVLPPSSMEQPGISYLFERQPSSSTTSRIWVPTYFHAGRP